jgi:hypothetical protein
MFWEVEMSRHSPRKSQRKQQLPRCTCDTCSEVRRNAQPVVPITPVIKQGKIVAVSIPAAPRWWSYPVTWNLPKVN